MCIVFVHTEHKTYRHALCADDDYDAVVVMLMVKFVCLSWW